MTAMIISTGSIGHADSLFSSNTGITLAVVKSALRIKLIFYGHGYDGTSN